MNNATKSDSTALGNVFSFKSLTKPYMNVFNNATAKREFNEIMPLGSNFLVDKITCNDKTIFLNQPLEYVVSICENKINIDVKKLKFKLLIDNLMDFSNAIVEHLLFLWNNYAKENDTNLTDRARKLKQLIIECYSVQYGV